MLGCQPGPCCSVENNVCRTGHGPCQGSQVPAVAALLGAFLSLD